MKLAIVINQSPAETTAHMLYIARLAADLANARPSSEVHLVFPVPRFNLAVLGIAAPKNLFLHPLFAMKKRKKKAGLTLNFIFYHRATGFLKKLQPDIIFSASFDKLFYFLLKRKKYFPKTKFSYEFHELAELNPGQHKNILREVEIIKTSDKIFATTHALAALIHAQTVTANVLPLGCAYKPEDFSSKNKSNEPFTLGYIGSTYKGQGVDWLAKNWNPNWGQLIIIGGKENEFSSENVISYDKKTIAEIREKFLSQIDALVIPSENIGRMPFVAITKSFDYLAMKRPILASNLPSITEVLRDGKEALIFKAGNIHSFEEKLMKLKNDESLREKMIENSVERAKELSFEKRIEGFWKAIEG